MLNDCNYAHSTTRRKPLLPFPQRLRWVHGDWRGKEKGRVREIRVWMLLVYGADLRLSSPHWWNNCDVTCFRRLPLWSRGCRWPSSIACNVSTKRSCGSRTCSEGVVQLGSKLYFFLQWHLIACSMKAECAMKHACQPSNPRQHSLKLTDTGLHIKTLQHRDDTQKEHTHSTQTHTHNSCWANLPSRIHTTHALARERTRATTRENARERERERVTLCS